MDRLFAGFDAPVPQRLERRAGVCFGRDECFLLGENIQIDGQEACRDCAADGDMVGVVALADTACTDIDDRVRTLAVNLPQVVHAVPDVLIGLSPAAVPNRVADDHVQFALPVEVERDDRAELNRVCRFDVLHERLADAADVVELRIHPNDDIGTIFWRRDVAHYDVFNQE